MRITETQIKQMAIEEIQLMIENGELDEGFFDRMGAKFAGAKAGLGAKAKGFGQRVGAGVKGAVAGATGDVAGVEKAAAAGAAGKQAMAGAAEKAQAMKAWKLISGKLKDLQKDMIALKIPMTGPESKGIKVALHGLERAVYGSLAKRAGADPGTGTAAAAAQPAAPAAAPAAQPQLKVAAEGKIRRPRKRRK